MDRIATIQTLEAELVILQRRWTLSMERADDTLKNYAGRQVSAHLGFNLAACAAELSELAGKIESTERILAYVKEQA